MAQPYKFILAILLSSVSVISLAQSKNTSIIKVTYTSTPISQYQMTESDMRSTPTKASLYDFMKGITSYYSLYINLKDRSSVYALDSTVQIRPIGWTNPRTTAALADTVLFSLKTADNQTFKNEWIMNQIFFSEGRIGDIKWQLLDEQKTIDGLKCQKAVSKDKYPMLTVWYTKDLPVSNGPSIWQGLPGLVVWAEDYFRTVQLFKISYSNDTTAFDRLFNAKYQIFITEKTKGKHFDTEPLVLVKKGDLAKRYYEYYHEKPYVQ